MVKASSFKNWCVENISPQSWSRICLKSLDKIRDSGYALKEFERLDEDIELSPELYETLNEALSALYDMTVSEEALA